MRTQEDHLRRYKQQHKDTKTYHAHGLVLAVAVPVEDLDLQGPVHVTIAQAAHGDLGRLEHRAQVVVHLVALPHHRVLAVLVHSVDMTQVK